MNAISGFGKGTEDKPFSNEYQGVQLDPFLGYKKSTSKQKKKGRPGGLASVAFPPSPQSVYTLKTKIVQ